jgi:trk system potassium uptake protein TrkH
MNRKMIGKILGYLFFLEALFLIPAGLISLFRYEFFAVRGIFLTVMLLCVLSAGLLIFCRNASQRLQAREGFITVALAWFSMSVFGALPFWFSREIPHYIDALFETVSGFTTTGASVLTNVEGLSHGLLYWRSFSNWLGGMGMLVFLLAVLQNAQGSGNFLHLLRAESPGPSVTKMTPKTRKSAKILYAIYIGMTVACMLFLLAGGMPLFDSICHALSAAGTGGFSIKNASAAAYSPYCQNVMTVFLILFGVNFNMYYFLLLREIKAVLRDEELRLYFCLIASSVVLIALNIAPQFASLGQAFHHAAFNVSSIISTAGFSSDDYNLWPEFSKAILLMLMLLGASAGSTAGGLKSIRVLILFKNIRRYIRKILYPRSVEVIKVNHKTIDEEVVSGVTSYTVIYFFLIFFTYLLVSLDNFSFGTTFSAAVACINNIGPGFGAVGPSGNFSAFSAFSKLVLCFSMILGRLEIFPVIILFSPRSWRKKSSFFLNRKQGWR